MDVIQSPENVVRRLRPDIPLTCFRPQMLDTAARWFLDRFPGKVLYAVKVNPAPYVVSRLAGAGIQSFDAASVAEIRLVRELCPDAHIAFMHPVKSRTAIEQAYFDHGVRDFVFDSAHELEKIISVTGDSRDLNLFLRLAVPNVGSNHPLAGKFGAAPGAAPALLRAARRRAKKLGICFHVGSQTMDPSAWVVALETVAGVLRAAPRTKVDIIDVGGGFPAAYPGMTPPPLEAFMQAIEDGIARLPRPDSHEFWCEPGRALVAESTSIIVNVELRKGDALYINDGTYGSLFDAGHMGMVYPVRLLAREGDGRKPGALKPFRFYGPTCDSIDHMPGPFMLPAGVKEGDYIEIGQMGAYGNAMRTDFNGFSEHMLITVDTPPLMSLFGDPLAHKARELCVA